MGDTENQISKRKALKALKKNKKLAEEILKKEYDRDDIDEWRRDTKDKLSLIFNKDHDFYKEFEIIRYSPLLSVSDEGDRREVIRSAYSGLEYAIKLLDKCIIQTTKFGLPFQKVSVNPLWYKIGIPTLLFLISGFLTLLLFEPARQWIGIANDDVYDVTDREIFVTSVKKWNEINKINCEKAYDSIRTAHQRNGTYKQGVYFKETIEYFENYRRQMDFTIDSLNIIGKKYSVNLNSLGIRKKLPIRLNDILYPLIRNTFHFDEPVIQRMYLDTL